MNRRYAHLSRTALAVLAAAGTVWLAAFFLPGAVVEPIPLLPAIGSAAGKIVAAPGTPTRKRAAAAKRAAVTHVVAPAQLASVTFRPEVPPARPEHRAVRPPQHVHVRHQVSRPKHFAPAQKAAPAPAPAATAAAPVFDSSAPPGRAVGWHRKHDQVAAPASAPSSAPITAAPGHGHGNGNGHAKHDSPVPQPAATPAAPVAPPSTNPGNGHDNGKHLGDQHDHGDQGHGPGGNK